MAQFAGVVNEVPVPMAVPPKGTAYQFKVPPVPVAVKLAVTPSITVTDAGAAEGAAGEPLIVTTWIPEKVAPFLIILTTPEVPTPAKASI